MIGPHHAIIRAGVPVDGGVVHRDDFAGGVGVIQQRGLLGRARFGWRGRNAVRILYAGAGLLLLAYVGSRFVMEVVLGRST